MVAKFRFSLITVSAFMQKNDKALSRRFRQLSFISQFTTKIGHIKDDDNLVADALSRIESVRFPLDFYPADVIL